MTAWYRTASDRQHRTGKGKRWDEPVRKMVAQAVQHAMVTTEDRPPLPPKPNDVDRVEGLVSEPNVTVVRVHMDGGKMRVFTITVRENI